jgi:hypothetical protein
MADASSLWAVHRGHILMLVAWLAIVGVVYAVGIVRRHKENGPVALSRSPWLVGAAGASVASGAVHLAVIREHFAEAALYGWFFLVLTLLQAGWAVAVVVRPSRIVLTAGAVASLGVVMLWLATRTVGIPLGPAAGETEAFGGLDIAASALELAVALCAATVLLAGRHRRSPVLAG